MLYFPNSETTPYWSLARFGYAFDAEKVARRDHLGRFFEHIGQPIRGFNDTSEAFREMMFSGRMNERMREGIEASKSR